MTTPADVDGFVDPQKAALLALCTGALNANLATSAPSDFPIVTKAYGWNPDRTRISQAECPCLWIWRMRQRTVAVTTVRTEHLVTWAFHYTMGPATRDRAESRWALPPLVWEELVRVIGKGHDPAVSADALILRAAGFVRMDEKASGRVVDFEKPEPGGDVWPGFTGTMDLSHRREIDLSALQDLLELDAQYRLSNRDGSDQLQDEDPTPDVGSETLGKQPLVRELLETPDP